MTRHSLALLLACLFARSASAETYRWIEAEKPILTNFGANPFAPKTDAERAQLSGGAWIGASGKRRIGLSATYDVNVPDAGDYRFFARKFWKHGPYRIRMNDGPWLNVGPEVPLLDSATLRPDIVANWTLAGTVSLHAGANRFRIESTQDDGPIAFDCFLITNGDFVPRGTTKPDERLKSNEPGWFAWDPPPVANNAALDLRYLNEPFAGSDGRIIAKDGRFVHETSGKSVRFWGVNCGADVMKLDDRELERLAALLASRGVNLVRLHGPIYAQEGANAGKLDAEQVANVKRAVHVFKRFGIYSTLSIYFPSWLRLDESNGWPGYTNQTPYALLFFDEKFQAMYREWWRALLTTPDADGKTLANEPAVLSLEMLNEDSLFFWTFQPRKTIPATTSDLIDRRFSEWLTRRYGDSRKDTVIAAGELEASRLQPRAKDSARFLFEVERDFYTSTRAFLRDELGARSLISASNWTTASDAYLTPIERAANLAGDFIDRHGYYNAKHEGRRAASQVEAGDSYSDRSALRFDPEKPGDGVSAWNPAFDTSYNDVPTMVSEIDWPEPNRFRAEAPLLTAMLAAQQDTDAIAFFAAVTSSWQPTTSKFGALTPVALGQYPAAALIYRLGLIDEVPAIDTVLNLNELLDLGGGVRIDGKARFLGQSRVTINDGPTSRPAVDLSRGIDEEIKVIRTGQTELDYGRGLLTIDAPSAKAAVGFLQKSGEIALGNLTIVSTMEYGAIAIVSLDGETIEKSQRLLVQVMSEQRNAGFTTHGEGMKTIDSLGHAPVLVRMYGGSITFRNDMQWAAQPLDQNGTATGDPLAARRTLELLPSTPYYILTRSSEPPR